MCFARRTIYTGLARGLLGGLIGLALQGCAWLAIGVTPYTRDLTEEPEAWGGYEVGRSYELLRDVFVVQNPYMRKPELNPPETDPQIGIKIHSSPPSLEVYRSAPQAYPDIVGWLEAGARLRLVTVKEKGSLADRDRTAGVYLYFEVLDGPRRGEVIEGGTLSGRVGREFRGMTLLKPHPDLLRAVP